MFSFLKNIGSTELIIIVVVIMFFFGSKIVREFGKTSGHTLKEIKGIKKTFKEAFDDSDTKDGE